MVRALIADSLAPEIRDGLDALGVESIELPSVHADELPDHMEGVDILVLGGTRVSRRTVEAGGQLKLIVRAAQGVDTVDVSAASRRGVFVAHCPGHDADANAEAAVGLLVALDRVGSGGAGAPVPRVGMAGRTLGVDGFGPTGRAVGRLGAALHMRVVVSDDALTDARATETHVQRADDADALFRRSDVVVLTGEGGGAAGGEPVATAERLALLGDEGLLVALGAPASVDLLAAAPRVAAGTLGLGIVGPGDEAPEGALVFPPDTVQAGREAAAMVIQAVQALLTHGRIPHCVNLASPDTAAPTLVVRHRNEVGALVKILAVLQEQGVNVFDVATVLFHGNEAASTRLRVGSIPSPGALTRMGRDDAVFAVELVE